MHPLVLPHLRRGDIKIEHISMLNHMKCVCKQKYQWPVRAVQLRGGFFSSQWMESGNELNGGVIRCIS